MSKDNCCSNKRPGTNFREAVCIHTDKVFDSCRDKDCLEDLRVYLTQSGQEVVDRAISIKVTKAEIIWVFTDIESVPFNRGFYSIDLKYFFRIVLHVYTGVGRPTEVEGLATFNKRVILFGSDGNAKIFSSKYKQNAFDPQQWKKTNMPYAVVEVVEPITLGEKLVDVRQNSCCCDEDFDIASVPESVCRVFDDPLVVGGEAKRAFVSLGVFSIIKLERRVQLLVPSYDYCIPNKECVGATADNNPCDLFDRIDFPLEEFYPPSRCKFIDSEEDDPSISHPEPEEHCHPVCKPVCPPPYKPACVMPEASHDCCDKKPDCDHNNNSHCGCGNNNNSNGSRGIVRRY